MLRGDLAPVLGQAHVLLRRAERAGEMVLKPWTQKISFAMPRKPHGGDFGGTDRGAGPIALTTEFVQQLRQRPAAGQPAEPARQAKIDVHPFLVRRVIH
ncbi:MAG TPA: hypothetical protein PK867_11500 [Pirellulales bacterium]|nr:hypothetical protein [Pirellulales bacterium]